MGSAIGVNLNSIFFQMNKIYSSQIEKANSLAGGIEKNAAKLKASNVSVDLQKLKECTLQLAELAEKQDAVEAALPATQRSLLPIAYAGAFLGNLRNLQAVPAKCRLATQ